ncbi:hypothetical protein [uncultured Clostridium sp.]|uniref:hypothetical protein n=1 Tax=uncultured Clostridium sp. TaxID=59620 RepID=UPI0028E2F3AF|nr:hypothetical protein [uncultured Clostridium sp.]
MVINSDAHFCTKICEFISAIELLKEVDFPDEFIINSKPEDLLLRLNKKENYKI